MEITGYQIGRCTPSENKQQKRKRYIYIYIYYMWLGPFGIMRTCIDKVDTDVYRAPQTINKPCCGCSHPIKHTKQHEGNYACQATKNSKSRAGSTISTKRVWISILGFVAHIARAGTTTMRQESSYSAWLFKQLRLVTLLFVLPEIRRHLMLMRTIKTTMLPPIQGECRPTIHGNIITYHILTLRYSSLPWSFNPFKIGFPNHAKLCAHLGVLWWRLSGLAQRFRISCF